MRNFNRFLLPVVLLAGVLFSTSCDDGKLEYEKLYDLSVDTPALDFYANDIVGKSVKVTTTAPSWIAVPTEDWVSIEKSDNGFVVTVETNTTGTSRNAEVHITGRGIDAATVKIVQNNEDTDYLVLSEPSLSFGTAAGQKEIMVMTTFGTWSADPEEGAGWITVTDVSDGVKIAVTDNDGAVRSADVVFTASGLANPVKLTINQDGYPVFEYQHCSYEILSAGDDLDMFVLYLYNDEETPSMTLEGFIEKGHTAIPEGSYSVTKTAAANTLLSAEMNSVFELSGCAEEFRSMSDSGPKVDLFFITGGEMNIGLDGTIYTISANFSGYMFYGGDYSFETRENQLYYFNGRLNLEETE